jgi:hypothetical protein
MRMLPWGYILLAFLTLLACIYIVDTVRYERELLDEYTYDGMEIPEYAK